MDEHVIYDYLGNHAERNAMLVAYLSVAVCAAFWLTVCTYARRLRRRVGETAGEKRLADLTVAAVVLTVVAIVCGSVAGATRLTACQVRDGECASVEGPIEGFAVTERLVGRGMVRVYTFKVAG